MKGTRRGGRGEEGRVRGPEEEGRGGDEGDRKLEEGGDRGGAREVSLYT